MLLTNPSLAASQNPWLGLSGDLKNLPPFLRLHNCVDYLCVHFSAVDDCEQSPCENGGQCLNTAEGHECQCLQGYGGMDCENGE